MMNELKEKPLIAEEMTNIFINSGFFIAGSGCFDVSLEEVEIIFQYIIDNNKQGLENYYRDLSESRLPSN